MKFYITIPKIFDFFGDVSHAISGPAKPKVRDYIFAKFLANEDLDAFWKKCDMGEKKGCYVFVNGSTPVYVGMTNVSFRQEIFMPHKRVLLNKLLNTASKRKLQVYFITTEERGRFDEIIGEIEAYLIIQAKRANEKLLNEKNTAPKWSIPGIYGETKIGKPSMAARMLKKNLKL